MEIEIELLQINCSALENDRPGGIDVCNSTCFQNIRMLLLTFATLPVSIATAERSFSVFFSVLKLLKSNLLCKMDEECLRALTLAYPHSDSFDYQVSKHRGRCGGILLFDGS